MIELKKDIPSEFGLDGKQGEIKTFGSTVEAMLISNGIAVEFVETVEEIKPAKKK